MMNCEKLNSLEDIPKNGTNFQGYLWYSDKNCPEVFDCDKSFQFDRECLNPFIIESNLYDVKEKVSYFIKWVDGNYIVLKYDLHYLDNKFLSCDENDDIAKLDNSFVGVFVRKEFETNKVTNKFKICFNEYWVKCEDEYCNKMEVLKPQFTVFVGFESYKK